MNAEGSAACSVAGSRPWLQREHQLDHPCDPGRGLRVSEVGLQRAQPQRPLGAGAEHRLQRADLDRVAEPRPGAVALDRVDVRRAEPRALDRRADHPLLRRSVWRRQPLAAPVLADRRAAHQRQHRVSVRTRLGEPLEQQHPGALGPADPVRRRRERLAAAVRRQPLAGG
jgi:hypothetical protein